MSPQHRSYTEQALRDESDDRKKVIYDAMSPRRQRYIQKIGYDQWNPFDEPKDPIDIRTDEGSKRTAQQLFRDFLQSYDAKGVSSQFSRGVLEMAMGLVNNEDRVRAMYEFSLWYRDLLLKEDKNR